MVLAKRDAGAQWQGQSTTNWQTDFGKANRFRDAESYTMNAEGSDKKDSVAQTMQFELKYQSWLPHFSMPAIAWFRDPNAHGVPSAPPRPRERDDDYDEPVTGGSSGSRGKAPIRVMRGTTEDGTAYPIFVFREKVKQGAKKFAWGAAGYAKDITISVAKGALDFADYSGEAL